MWAGAQAHKRCCLIKYGLSYFQLYYEWFYFQHHKTELLSSWQGLDTVKKKRKLDSQNILVQSTTKSACPHMQYGWFTEQMYQDLFATMCTSLHPELMHSPSSTCLVQKQPVFLCFGFFLAYFRPLLLYCRRHLLVCTDRPLVGLLHPAFKNVPNSIFKFAYSASDLFPFFL